MQNVVDRPATQKQFNFIKKLLAERDVDESTQSFVDSARRMAVEGTLESKHASHLIDMLLDRPYATTKTESADEPEAGVYFTSTHGLVRVYLGQQSGRMLVKRIIVARDEDYTDVSYEYVGSASKVIVPDAAPRRLTLEEVGSLGVSYDHCLMCGRRLDDPESVDRGIGPVCAANY